MMSLQTRLPGESLSIIMCFEVEGSPTGVSLSCSCFFFCFFLLLFCSKAVHTISARQNHTQTTTRLAERIAILLFTYIIGDIYIHFWSFQIRHHQTCYTVSLSLNCHFLCKCYSAQLVKYLKQGTVRDAHIQTHTHTHAHTHTCGTLPRTRCIIHTKKHSGIAHQHSSLGAAHWSVYERMLKVSLFSLLYELICILPHQQVQDSGLRLW